MWWIIARTSGSFSTLGIDFAKPAGQPGRQPVDPVGLPAGEQAESTGRRDQAQTDYGLLAGIAAEEVLPQIVKDVCAFGKTVYAWRQDWVLMHRA